MTLINSAPENVLPKSDAGGDLVGSRITDSTNLDLKNLTTQINLGDVAQEANGTLLRVDDAERRIYLSVNENGETRSIADLNGGFGTIVLQAVGTLDAQLSLTSGGITLGYPASGQGTTIRINDSETESDILITAQDLKPTVDGTVNLGIPDRAFKRLCLDSTLTSSFITGNRTIDKAAGSVNFAAGASSLTVTNSLVSANSLVFAVIQTDDATALIKNVICAAGSFTINLQAPATTKTRVAFWVLN